ncbi:MAG: UDP-N-acetylmuramoyl-L-alanyl-D-glutamate--2,6-diaminopimelate ligase [Deltaproteobacteria bacterium]|nr:UDP-N-acetylmuramoyl-L-alanyl-D-glutamate--2,6-diaminopimelate ligase [Deltaproteobacteria bacterium]
MMRISELIDGLDIIERKIDEDFMVEGLTLDSREARKNYLFFAVKGSKTDGLKYAEDAVRKGAFLVTDRDVEGFISNKVSYVRVRDLVGVINVIAAKYYGYPHNYMKMVGITGTNGKSSTTFLIESIAKASGTSVGVIGTINYRYGEKIFPAKNTTPDPLVLMKVLSDMRDSKTELVVMEVSSHGLKLRRTEALKFDVVIFTNLSRDHLDFHPDMDDYFNSKRLLFTKTYCRDSNSSALINIDDEYGKRLMSEDFPKKFGYSIKDKKAFVHCLDYEVGEESIKASILVDGKRLQIESNLLGLHNLYNIMAASGAMYVLGIDLDKIVCGIKTLEFVPGRLQKVRNEFGIRCLIDYAHTDDALRNVLSALKGLKHRKIITVFGAGGDRDKGKRPLMARAVCEYSNIVIITSDNPRTEDPYNIMADIESGMDNSFIRVPSENITGNENNVYTLIKDRSEAIRRAIIIAQRGDIVLIAGKGHEDYIIEGETKRHFSDLEEAKKAFEERRMRGI